MTLKDLRQKRQGRDRVRARTQRARRHAARFEQPVDEHACHSLHPYNIALRRRRGEPLTRKQQRAVAARDEVS